MIPAFQGFLFGGGVNPYMSRVATYFLKDHLEEHVKLLINIYRDKRDAMLRGLREELTRRTPRSASPKAGSSSGSSCPPAPTPGKLPAARAGAAVFGTRRVRPSSPNGGGADHIRLALSYEPPERCYEGARLIAQAILDARS